jgi:hypothetical protein
MVVRSLGPRNDTEERVGVNPERNYSLPEVLAGGTGALRSHLSLSGRSAWTLYKARLYHVDLWSPGLRIDCPVVQEQCARSLETGEIAA